MCVEVEVLCGEGHGHMSEGLFCWCLRASTCCIILPCVCVRVCVCVCVCVCVRARSTCVVCRVRACQACCPRGIPQGVDTFARALLARTYRARRQHGSYLHPLQTTAFQADPLCGVRASTEQRGIQGACKGNEGRRRRRVERLKVLLEGRPREGQGLGGPQGHQPIELLGCGTRRVVSLALVPTAPTHASQA